MTPATSAFAEGRFLREAGGRNPLTRLAIAAGLGTISARVGLAWGGWMRKVRR